VLKKEPQDKFLSEFMLCVVVELINGFPYKRNIDLKEDIHLEKAVECPKSSLWIM
jgi:hypothetical protein